MYRPEGWDADKDAHIALRDNDTWVEDEHTACYEAGADAMLVGLRKEGKHTDALPSNFSITVDKKGVLVFIPEEENDGGD